MNQSLTKSDERAFAFLRVNERQDKPRTRGVTEVRGPYYAPMGKRYLEDILETMGAYEEIIEFLSSLRGIGRWSADYVLLRGLGRVNIFPGDDIGAKNNLQRLFKLDERPSYEKIRELTSQWYPYQGLVYFHLLLDKLHAKGFL